MKLTVWLDKEQIDLLSQNIRVNCGQCHLFGKAVEIEIAPSASGMLKDTKMLSIEAKETKVKDQ